MYRTTSAASEGRSCFAIDGRSQYAPVHAKQHHGKRPTPSMAASAQTQRTAHDPGQCMGHITTAPGICTTNLPSGPRMSPCHPPPAHGAKLPHQQPSAWRLVALRGLTEHGALLLLSLPVCGAPPWPCPGSTVVGQLWWWQLTLCRCGDNCPHVWGNNNWGKPIMMS
jgi:hypothetical protein